MLQGVLIDEAIEVLFQLARDFRRSPRARAIDQALDSLASKTIDPLAESGIGKGESVRDGLQTLPFHDVAHGLGTAEDASFFGLLDEGVQGRERVIGKVQFEGPHLRVSRNKILQKYENLPSHDIVTLLSAQNLSDSNFPEAAYNFTINTLDTLPLNMPGTIQSWDLLRVLVFAAASRLSVHQACDQLEGAPS